MWLDADFPGARSRNSRGKTLPSAIREAERMLDATPEGQVGVFQSYGVGPMHGYVIKTRTGAVYFEPATDSK